MKEKDEKRIAAKFAKILAMMCVRNTELEDIHAGIVPVTKIGDFSDVKVIDADGNEIPWPEVSHFDDDIMRGLMKRVVNRIYTFHLKIDDPHFRKLVDDWMLPSLRWDKPELDAKFLKAIESRRKREEN